MGLWFFAWWGIRLGGTRPSCGKGSWESPCMKPLPLALFHYPQSLPASAHTATANSTPWRYTKIMKGGTGIPVIHIGLVVSNPQVFPIDVEILFALFPFQPRAINNFKFKQKVEPGWASNVAGFDIWKVDRKTQLVPCVCAWEQP